MAVDSQGSWCVPEQRRRLIAEYVSRQEWVSIGDLAAAFHISPATARRDLAALARRRRLVRVHGGAGALHRQGQGW